MLACLLPIITLGMLFYEPYGTTHVFIENLNSTEDADVLAIMVHDEGAPLTTFLD